MKALSLSNSELAARVFVSHVMVGKWKSKGAKPHGKERLKELGMALAMNEAELNSFLKANCYPRLYSKNPLDVACRFILSKSAGDNDIVSIYRKFLTNYNLDSYVLSDAPDTISTSDLSIALNNIKSIGGFENWMKENDRHFRAFGKVYIPNLELIRFIILYIGKKSIYGMYITGQLPVTIKNLLHPLIADKEIAVKGLRAKLIVYGLYENMNEDEINIMLDIAKLQRITEPASRVDCAILTALRCAHERYPYYEYNNAKKVLDSIRESRENEATEFQAFYEEQFRQSGEFVNYYENGGQKGELDRFFEEAYTDYAGNGILEYIQDIFALLVEDGALSETEISEYVTLMQTY
jgi:hypothetical protein